MYVWSHLWLSIINYDFKLFVWRFASFFYSEFNKNLWFFPYYSFTFIFNFIVIFLNFFFILLFEFLVCFFAYSLFSRLNCSAKLCECVSRVFMCVCVWGRKKQRSSKCQTCDGVWLLVFVWMPVLPAEWCTGERCRGVCGKNWQQQNWLAGKVLHI